MYIVRAYGRELYYRKSTMINSTVLTTDRARAARIESRGEAQAIRMLCSAEYIDSLWIVEEVTADD